MPGVRTVTADRDLIVARLGLVVFDENKFIALFADIAQTGRVEAVYRPRGHIILRPLLAVRDHKHLFTVHRHVGHMGGIRTEGRAVKFLDDVVICFFLFTIHHYKLMVSLFGHIGHPL